MSATAWRVFPDPEHLVVALADAVIAEATHALATRGAFDLVLAGGSTPQALYRALAARGAGSPHWQIWYGDERCLPVGDPERNSVMAQEAWLAGADIPEDNWHTIPAELGPEAGAAAYGALLQGVGPFDLVLLGAGEDGHTASLFPGRDWGTAADSPDVIAIRDAPKPPEERVSLSAARLARSHKVWFIVTGARKLGAIRRWRSGETMPATAIEGRDETLVWLDAAAA